MAVFINYIGLLALLSTFVNFYECEVTIPTYNPSIPENSKSKLVVTINATTNETEGVEWAYSLTSDSSAFEFADPANGALTTKSDANLDYETATNQIVVITATDGNTTATATVTVTITDVNDNAPIFNPSTYSVTVDDNLPADTSVATVTATDADGTDANNVITFTITAESNTDDRFTISSSGLVSVSTGKTLARKDNATYDLVVLAEDNGSPALNSSATLHVCVGKELCNINGAAAFASTLIAALLVPLATMLR